MAEYGTLPANNTLKISDLNVAFPAQKLQDLEDLLRLAKLGPKTYENSGGDFGVSYQWMSDAKEYWAKTFDWRSVETRINAFPNYMAQVPDGDSTHNVHLVALFSKRRDAIPLMCMHGWPGSILEYLDVLSIFKTKYAATDLPYHVIVPSLPGYAFSEGPPLDKDWGVHDSARLLHNLMVGLGFESGYAVQGGDIGSFTSRMMAVMYDSCKVMHLNFNPVICPDVSKHGQLPLEPVEKEALERGDRFVKLGTAYSFEHGTKTSTIGFVLSSSPLALLAWVGEKFLSWTDKWPSLDQVLESVTLYWLTDTISRSLHPYRQEIIDPTSIRERHWDYSKAWPNK